MRHDPGRRPRPEGKADEAASAMGPFEAHPLEDGTAGGGQTREEIAPVAEERLSSHKSNTGTGGVRVASHATKRPVGETVTLREEHVSAEQRPADRALSPEEADAAFGEKTVEMMGVPEEVEVRKTARAVVKVSLARKTTERGKTVRDTVREAEVDVEKIDASSRKRKQAARRAAGRTRRRVPTHIRSLGSRDRCGSMAPGVAASVGALFPAVAKQLALQSCNCKFN